MCTCPLFSQFHKSWSFISYVTLTRLSDPDDYWKENLFREDKFNDGLADGSWQPFAIHFNARARKSLLILCFYERCKDKWTRVVFHQSFFNLLLAVDCGPPRPFQNGSISGRSTVYPNVMHLSCDEGFILRGSSEIQCQTSGTWSKTASFCKGKNPSA